MVAGAGLNATTFSWALASSTMPELRVGLTLRATTRSHLVGIELAAAGKLHNPNGDKLGNGHGVTSGQL
jgi:hypothetical protein